MTTTTETRPQQNAPRLPAQPLFDRIANAQGVPRAGLKLVARATGVDQSTVARWRDRGLTVWHADRLCCRIGLMPHLVWDGWYQLMDSITVDDPTADEWARGDG